MRAEEMFLVRDYTAMWSNIATSFFHKQVLGNIAADYKVIIYYFMKFTHLLIH